MSDDPVLYEAADHVAVVTFNRPNNRNSMTAEVLDGFRAAIARARADASLRCVVVTGKGSCFSAGADFKAQLQREGEGRRLEPHERSFAMYEPFLSVLDVEVPTIAALNGHAIGGGFGLALACDLRVASRAARYGANFAKLGLHSGLGISYLLPRLIGPVRAAEMLFTGRVLDGTEAEAIGLMSRVVDADDVRTTALAMAKTIAASAPIAVRMMKKTFYRGLGWDVRGAAFEEAYAQAVTLATRDAAEGIAALMEKREPKFTGE
jgi:enoyl-CoA hydratase/carnithine racemase